MSKQVHALTAKVDAVQSIDANMEEMSDSEHEIDPPRKKRKLDYNQEVDDILQKLRGLLTHSNPEILATVQKSVIVSVFAYSAYLITKSDHCANIWYQVLNLLRRTEEKPDLSIGI